MKIVNRLRERGYKPGYLAGNRAYNSSEPEEWQLPIRAMGYKPVYDYRADLLGEQAETHGAILIEGRWYCPLAEGIESAGSRRIRGIAAQTILLAFQLAHANRRKIKQWLETLALCGERPRRRTHHRRKTKTAGAGHPPAISCRPPDPGQRPQHQPENNQQHKKQGPDREIPHRWGPAASLSGPQLSATTRNGPHQDFRHWQRPVPSVLSVLCARGELNPHALAGTGT
ncbi:hypothetical protein GCM10010307_63830 [Streptomyces vastus]|uniref:Transposase n=1 Tax=Streptomyces vastus TaxID=285451 RepID=A0ABN3RHT9_9ACTN